MCANDLGNRAGHGALTFSGWLAVVAIEKVCQALYGAVVVAVGGPSPGEITEGDGALARDLADRVEDDILLETGAVADGIGEALA